MGDEGGEHAIGPHDRRLYLEDALSEAPGHGIGGRVEDGSVALVLCDPPFGITSRNEWDKELDLVALFARIERAARPDAAVVFFSQGMLTARLMTGPWSRHWRFLSKHPKRVARGNDRSRLAITETVAPNILLSQLSDTLCST